LQQAQNQVQAAQSLLASNKEACVSAYDDVDWESAVEEDEVEEAEEDEEEAEHDASRNEGEELALDIVEFIDDEEDKEVDVASSSNTITITVHHDPVATFSTTADPPDEMMSQDENKHKNEAMDIASNEQEERSVDAVEEQNIGLSEIGFSVAKDTDETQAESNTSPLLLTVLQEQKTSIMPSLADVAEPETVPYPLQASSMQASLRTAATATRTDVVDLTAASTSYEPSSSMHHQQQPKLAKESPALTQEHFQQMLENEQVEEQELRKKRNAAMRDAEQLTEEMKDDVMALLRAFDLPFIVAPFEAEAQCAVLEELGLVDGVVTEDSDAFLFGAQTVFKNIFNDKKFVEMYTADDAKRELGLERKDFVALAYFLGSDYTDGITGVGIVNAMEIIQAFPMRSESGPIDGLKKFRKWLDGYDFKHTISEVANKLKRKTKSATKTRLKKGKKSKRSKVGDLDDDETSTTSSSLEDEEKSEGGGGEDDSGEEEFDGEEVVDKKLRDFQKKHKTGRQKWSVPPIFPDEKVSEAYMMPQANRDTTPFDFTVPKLFKVRAFCKDMLGWTEAEMDVKIDPLIHKYAEKNKQTRIDSHFFTYQDQSRVAHIGSTRLTAAVEQITGKQTDLSLFGGGGKKKRKSKSKDDPPPVEISSSSSSASNKKMKKHS